MPPAAPNLILQVQRLGDLVLSFPLFSWLAQAEPEHPVWVVAEPEFFNALMPLAPSVVFFPPTAEKELRRRTYRRVINLSHRAEAARLAGSLQAEEHFGLYTAERNGQPENHIGGPWNLYRASLVHNNRHNLFHWADLNALDIVGVRQPDIMLRTAWPTPRVPSGSGRVGLFVGASEAAKRPEPAFWGALAIHLVERGYKPVFLGGRAERSLAYLAARQASMINSNLCEHFNLSDLVTFLGELDLLITPDTGPMHVAAWAGTLTLNLSMGPVNPWETAPFPPGHLILRPTWSCTGCWMCQRLPAPLSSKQNSPAEAPCKALFQPARIANLVHSLLRNETGRLPTLPGLALSQSRRVRQGLFDMLPRDGRPPMNQRRALSDFWQQFFLTRLGGPTPSLDISLKRLHNRYPLVPPLLRKAVPALSIPLAQALRQNSSLDPNYWLRLPPLARPLASFVQLMLENANYSRPARLAALEHVAFLEELFS